MNNLIPFSFDGAAVRVVMHNGEPWFVAKDVCDVLEIANPWDAVSALDRRDVEKVLLSILNLGNSDVQDEAPKHGGARSLNIVSESGLFALVFRSRKPEALRFQRWVTSEVLPSIRKTGCYIAIPDDSYARAAIRFEYLKRVADVFGLSHNAALIAADNAVYKDYGISFKEKLQITLQADDNEVPLLVSEIGSLLGFEGSTVKRGAPVNGLLVELGYQERVGKSWVPTAKGAPYAFVSQTGKKHKDGSPVTQVKWKKSIVDFLR